MEPEQGAPGGNEPDRFRRRIAFELRKTDEHTFVQQLSKYVIHTEHSRRVEFLMRSIVLSRSDNF